jgi:septal ring factor EnvC (AmiA/AmiB activator)
MRGKTTITDIDLEIERLQQKRQELVTKASQRIARLCVTTGLAGLDVSDSELEKELASLAARFREKRARTVSRPAQTGPTPQPIEPQAPQTAPSHTLD